MKVKDYGQKILVFVLLLFFCAPNVFGTTLTSKGSSVITYDFSSGEISSSGKGGTMYNKKIDGATAYCSALKLTVPEAGTNYYLSSQTSNYNRDNYVAGQIILLGKKKYTGKKGYLYIQEALNCYFSPVYGSATYRTKDTNKYGFCSNNSKVKSLISTANSYVNEYQFFEGQKSSSLPAITIAPTSQVLGNVVTNSSGNYDYSSSPITISGIVTGSYGGNRSEYYSSTVPGYTLSISGAPSGATVQLCNDGGQCFANGATNVVDGTYYLKVINGGFDGGSINITLSGSNASSYPSANIWEPKKSGKQTLVTYVNPIEIVRGVSATQTFSYSPVGRYSAQIEKVDDTGAPLAGAKLKLYVADANENQIGDALCTTDGSTQTSCSRTDIKEADGYVTGNKLCYTEEQSPSGYQKIKTKCEPINLAATETKYHEYALQEDESWRESDISAEEFGYYTQFGGADVEKRNVYTLTNGTVVYELADVIYEYKYTGSDGKAVTYYSTSSVTEENGGIYRYGEVTQDEEGNDVYEHEAQVVRIPIVYTSDTPRGSLKEVYAYLTAEDKEKGTATYTILELNEDSEVDYHVKEPTETVTFVKEHKANSDTKKVCWLMGEGGKELVSKDSKYCDTNYYATKVATSNGSVHIRVVNTLNSVKISKRAITGDEELPGAVLSLYTADADGTCKKELVKSSNSSALKFTYKIYNPVESAGGEDNGDDGSGTGSSGDGTGDAGSDAEEEISDTTGVGLIEKNYVENGLRWVSTDAPVTVRGLAAGTYCLTEEVPAPGYVKTTTTTKFTINSDGNIEERSISGEYDKKNNVLVVRNQVNNLSISKTDIASTGELPGAVLKICKADKNEKGEYAPIIATGETGSEADVLDNCIVASLADGSTATWTSGNEPHKFSGLPTGSYALVEITAPNGYSVAEVIYFMMNDDGKLTDTNGNLLADNKLIMHDAPIVNVKTGMFPVYIVILILVIVSACVMVSYYYLNKKSMDKDTKIRKRKLHKVG